MDKVYISAYTDESFNELSHAARVYDPTTGKYVSPDMSTLKNMGQKMQAGHNIRMAEMAKTKKQEYIGKINKVANNLFFKTSYDGAAKAKTDAATVIRLADFANGKAFAAASSDARNELMNKLVSEYNKLYNKINVISDEILAPLTKIDSEVNKLVNEYNSKWGQYSQMTTSEADAVMETLIQRYVNQYVKSFNPILQSIDDKVFTAYNQWGREAPLIARKISTDLSIGRT